MLISTEQLIQKFGMTINGVLHLGAHQAEEASDYQKAGVKKVIWIEGNPELMPVLETELKKYPNQIAYNVLVSDNDEQTVNFKVTNNFQSSSILEFGTHKDSHPGINVHHTLSLKTQRLDNYFEKNKISITECDFLNIDLQGAELLALKGLGDKLDGIKYIYTEINVGNVYIGCATLYQLDKFLHQKGFQRVALKLTKWQWGDAFYIKSNPTYFQQKKNLISALFYQFIHGAYRIWILGYTKFKKVYSKLRGYLGKIKRTILRSAATSPISDTVSDIKKEVLSSIIKNSENKIVLVNIGLNAGLFTKNAIEELQVQKKNNYEIHLFEPRTDFYVALCDEFKNNPLVKINNFTLSDTEENINITSNTAVDANKMLKSSTKNILEYIKNNTISHVDLLILDTSFNNKKILLGAEEYSNPDKIKTIQFKYSPSYLEFGITLTEVVQLLMNKGYIVGKITNNKINYESDLGNFLEDYTTSDFIAINHKNK